MFVLQATSGNLIEDISATLESSRLPPACVWADWGGALVAARRLLFFSTAGGGTNNLMRRYVIEGLTVWDVPAVASWSSGVMEGELPKWQTERHGWREPGWHLPSAFCLRPVSDSTPTRVTRILLMGLCRPPPDHPTPPPTPWSPAIQTTHTHTHLTLTAGKALKTPLSWCCEATKRGLSLIQCASDWFNYGFIGKYVFSHANQVLSSKNLKKGVCKDTRMAKKCTFYKSHKKTQSHEWVSTDNTTSVIVSSDSGERDRHVG